MTVVDAEANSGNVTALRFATNQTQVHNAADLTGPRSQTSSRRPSAALESQERVLIQMPLDIDVNLNGPTKDMLVLMWLVWLMWLVLLVL